MAEEFGAPITPEDEGSKKKIWIIIAVVVIMLCCCFSVIAGGLLWTNGDEWFGLAAQLSHLIL